jgi:outer membrane beta-barrel protein
MNLKKQNDFFVGLWVILSLAMLVFPASVSFGQKDSQVVDKNRFDQFQVRVIRPRFFNKRGRFELGGRMNVVMNQTFIYTYAGTFSLGYHFLESIGLELTGSYGFSVDKSDKSLLDDEFQIKTIIVRDQWDVGGAFTFTPIYGKYQLSSGRLIYFDTFIQAGAGLQGVDWQYDHCADPAAIGADNSFQSAPTPPARNTQSYPTFYGGVGQRYFLNQNLSLRWDVMYRRFNYDSIDGNCGRDDSRFAVTNESKAHQVVHMMLGASYFF